MIKRFSFIGREGFGGSLSSENVVAIAQNAMFMADNVLIATGYGRRKLGGQLKYHTGSFDQTASYPASGTPIRGIYEFWRTASMGGVPTSDIFIHQSNKVWSIPDRSSPGADRTGALSLSVSGIPCYVTFNQTLYFTTTEVSDGYNKWTGTGSAQAANAPADGVGKYICIHRGRMVMVGNNDFPFTVYISAPFDPETWTTIAGATSLQLDPDNDPEGITGCVSFQSRLYIFTRQSIYEIEGTSPDDFVVNIISSGIGCISHNSIQTVPNDVIFASERGVHSLRQVASGRQTETTFLSFPIQKLWTENINTAFWKRIWAEYEESTNNYLITIVGGSDTTNEDILAYNIETGQWTTWKAQRARAIARSYLNTRKKILAGREDGRISFLNNADRVDIDGNDYYYRWKTGVIYPGGYDVQKSFKDITILCSTDKQVTLIVEWSIDGQRSGAKSTTLETGEDVLGSTFVLGTSILGTGQYLPQTLSVDQIGFGIQITISSSSQADLEIHGFILGVEDNETIYS